MGAKLATYGPTIGARVGGPGRKGISRRRHGEQTRNPIGHSVPCHFRVSHFRRYGYAVTARSRRRKRQGCFDLGKALFEGFGSLISARRLRPTRTSAHRLILQPRPRIIVRRSYRFRSCEQKQAVQNHGLLTKLVARKLKLLIRPACGYRPAPPKSVITKGRNSSTSSG